MAADREPMDQVRQNLRIPWYRCPIEPARLKELTARSDLRGAFQAIGHIVLVALTGALTYYFFAERIWVGFAVALFAHGTIYSFIGGLATHELAHGTVFRTKRLNGLFLGFLSLISWNNLHDLKMSHTYHHLFTLHPRGDGEVVLPIRPTLHPLHLLQLLTLNLVGGGGEPFSYPIAQNLGGVVRLAFTGRFNQQWLEEVYAGHGEARKKSITWARILVAFHLALVVSSILFGLWPLPVLVTLAPFMANWLRYFVGTPMHTGLKDNVPDFRLCVRTITLDPFSQFLYWRMNWHTEHHMFAAVPCYNLKLLSRTIASDMPRPRTLVGAWREMRRTWKKQQADPGYQYDTPLPKHPAGRAGSRDSLQSSLGDLAPETLE